MKGVKFKIANNSKFSIKDANRDLKNIFSSNTLFSAIINNINLMYGEEEATKIIEKFQKGDISITSMFIGVDFYNIDAGKIENTVYFVPKPEVTIQNIDMDQRKLEENIIKRKKVKKIKMISLEALKEIGNSWLEEEKMFNFDLFNLVNIGSDLACTANEIKTIIKDELEEVSFIRNSINPHVKVNRMTNQSEQFFYQEEKVFQHQYIKGYRIEPFMYFMYSGELDSTTKSAINLIVDEGIGGRKSVGMGRFASSQYVDIDILDRKATNPFIVLSSYIPLKEELEYLAGYRIEKTNGYIYHKGGQPYRKKSIGTIGEGAIITEKVKGRIIDVTPLQIETPHKIYYYGKCFYIGIGGGKDE